MGGCLVNVVNKTWFDPSGCSLGHARDTGLGMRERGEGERGGGEECVCGGGGGGGVYLNKYRFMKFSLIKRVDRKNTDRNNESEVSSHSLVLVKKGQLKIRKTESTSFLPDTGHVHFFLKAIYVK